MSVKVRKHYPTFLASCEFLASSNSNECSWSKDWKQNYDVIIYLEMKVIYITISRNRKQEGK